MKRTGPTNIVIRKLIDDLKKAAKSDNAPVWASIAELLARPTRRRAEVNLSKINRYANEGEVIIVPGKVLGGGFLEKKVTIAAIAFSETALEKIKASGSRALTIKDLLKENRKASNIRIIT